MWGLSPLLKNNTEVHALQCVINFNYLQGVKNKDFMAKKVQKKGFLSVDKEFADNSISELNAYHLSKYLGQFSKLSFIFFILSF